MSLVLRIVLICASVLLLVFLVHNVKKSKMRIEDGLFWVLFAMLILLLAIFPGIGSFFSGLFGFQAPVNFIFLLFLLILILRDFASAKRISQLENRVKELAQQVAIDRLDHHDRMNEESHKDI